MFSKFKKISFKNRAFTLIELLAVIVILAVISLIATPIILNIIENVNRQAVLRGAEALLKASNLYYMSSQSGTEPFDTITFNCDKDKCTSLKTDDKGNPINLYIDGNVGTGTVIIDKDGNVSFKIEKSGYCTYKYASNKKINILKGSCKGIYIVDVAPVSFETDDWATIQKAVQLGNYPYKVGDTKTVTLSDFGTFTLRIANTSTPDDCKKEGFSQTACGFVVEFADIITEGNMNPDYTNKGGWKDSYLRQYVNDTIYKALPADLQDVIIDTFVVSSRGAKDSSNFETTDKLYLLATAEVWANGTTNEIEHDTARNQTRQLDYYAKNGVATDNYSAAIKKYNDEDDYWWLRSADSSIIYYFFGVYPDGDWNDIDTETHGVSPAFRIG